ncbi:MAG: hypothetical protein JRF63_15245, partial [Deltaproteobacteria bacterium]|nr:hypothetical protein [Deltaproteobacteria bacterium]
MDLVYKIITFWLGMAALWLIVLGPLCVFIGAKIARHKGLSYLRSAAINGLFFVAVGLIGVLWSMLLASFGVPQIATLVSDVVLAFAAGALIVKWLTKTPLKSALKIFGVAFILMAVIDIAVMLVFSIEEDLRPEVVEALEVEQDQDPDSNLFYALMGFSESPGKDAHRVGREMVEKFNRQLAERSGDSYNDVIHESEPIDMARYDELETLFEKEVGLDGLSPEDQELITAVFDANRDILAAYRDLRRYDRLQNTATPHVITPLPQYLTLMRANKLILAKAQVDFLAGDAEAALEALVGEIAFSRFLLAKSETLISKMISVALSKRCYQLYAELLDDETFVASDALLSKELANLEQAEWGLGEAMRWEFQAAAAIMFEVDEMGLSLATDGAPPVPELGFGLIWKENNAINMLHPWYDSMARDFELPAHEYKKLEIPVDSEIDFSFYDAITNPVAVILMQIAVPAFERYYQRMFVLDGLIRLVRLKQEIRVKQIATDGIPGYLAGVGDDLKNPYSLEPMVWDAEQRILSFEREPDDLDCRGEIAIPKLMLLQP